MIFQESGVRSQKSGEDIRNYSQSRVVAGAGGGNVFCDRQEEEEISLTHYSSSSDDGFLCVCVCVSLCTV